MENKQPYFIPFPEISAPSNNKKEKANLEERSIQILSLSYLEPRSISMEEFAEVDADMGKSNRSTLKEVTPPMPHGYTSSWRVFVLANYLYYSSLVMHFIGFAHKFLYTDPEVIVKMVSKVITVLTSSTELMDLIKNVDTVFHLKPAGSSKSMLNTLHRYVPSIHEQLQVDPNAKSINFRKWSLFADWEEIFGNDRTTGQFVEGPEDVEEIERIEAQEVANDMSLEFFIIVVDEDDAPAEGENQLAQEESSVSTEATQSSWSVF